MKKTYGVSIGLLAMGLAVLGAPVSKAQSRMAASESSGGSEPLMASAESVPATPGASSPEDLQKRIDALKAELADLNTELATETSTTPAAEAQDQSAPTPAPAAAPAPAPLPTPAMSGPLATGIPHELSAGPFGKIEVTGILSGIGLYSNSPFYTGDEGHEDISNAQVFIQKTSGWFQFYLQGGAYNLPVVGVPFAKTTDTVSGSFGPFPVGYVKLVKGSFSAEIGKLPTLIGDEYTFTFENMNVERGLLWNQEPAISRGIQLNDSYKKLSVSFSWNDGLYSNRFTSFSGLLAYAINGSNTLTFAAGGNAGVYDKNSGATFLYQNNQQIYNLIYTFTKGPVTISPYYQYTVVKSADTVYGTGAHTNGGAILANYNFKHGISLSVRPEYIRSSGSIATGEANLLGYGPGTGAYSFTVTPTWVKDAFFLRGDLSVVHLTNFVVGSDAGFGIGGTGTNQIRGVVEAGFMF
ncbi:MAG TPA: outer membrane beta-barrel protein [Candidatus Dormibacteraeota bacterium]|nr:outer membrane beta-barrel protein [Candidatus Dormibacteraeota bacterium]